MRNFDDNTWNEYLKEFLKEKGSDNEKKQYKNKGVLFEFLVEKILTLIFSPKNITFESTKLSNDGKKDFWALDKDRKLWWVECKNYNENISIDILSSTFSFADMHYVNYIIIFSYSKLNNNLLKYIGEHSYKFHEKVFIYDDKCIEQILINNAILFSTSHYSLNSFDSKTNHQNDIRTIFYNEINPKFLNIDTFDGYYDLKQLTVGDLYNINVLIKNENSNCDYKIITSIKESDVNYYYDFLTLNNTKSIRDQQKFILHSNEIILIKYIVKLIAYKSTITLPNIDIKIIDYSNQIINPLSTKEYICKNSNKKFFIGKNYESIVTELKESCHKFTAFLVYGKSGTGKTRILEECHSGLIQNGYNILNFIGFDKKNTWKEVIKQLIYNIFYTDPNEKKAKVYHKEYNDFIDSQEQEKIVKLIKMINCNNFNIEDIKPYYNIISKKLALLKCAIIVDNLQSFDQDLSVFFLELIDSLNYIQNNKTVTLLFSINTDLIYENKLYDFITFFENNQHQYPYVNIICHYIKGFENINQAISFLQSLLLLNENSINYIFLKQLLNHMPFNPKLIEQISVYLFQNNIVTIKNNIGVIYDTYKFYSSINEIPKNFELIFIKTFNQLLDKYKNISIKIKDYLSVLYLFSEVNEQMLNLLNLDCKTEKILYNHGIIREINNGNSNIYVFEHDLIEKCISKKIYPDIIKHVSSILKNYHDIFCKIFKDRISLYYLCMLSTNKISYLEIRKALLIDDYLIPNKFKFDYYSQLIYNIILNYEKFNELELVQGLKYCCIYIKDHISEVSASSLFKTAYPHVMKLASVSREIIYEQFSFMIHFCENKMRLADDTLIYDYQKYLFDIENMKNNENFKYIIKELNYAQAYIYNRLFVFGKKKKNYIAYIDYLVESLKISEQNKFYDILFENYFDEAEIYLHQFIHVTCATALLNTGFYYYDLIESKKTKRKFKVNYYSKKIVYYIIKKEISSAIVLCDEACSYIENNNEINYHSYFKSVYLKYKIIAYLFEKNQLELLEKLFIEYEKICILVRGTLDTTFYFYKTKLSYLANDKYNFCFSCVKCLSLMEKEKQLTIKEKNIIMEDLAIKIRLLNVEKEIRKKLDFKKILYNDKLISILLMSKKDFDIFLNEYQSHAILSNQYDSFII